MNNERTTPDNKYDSQKSAIEYLSNYKINNIFKEMINSIVHDQPTDPIPYMVRIILKKLYKYLSKKNYSRYF